MISPFDLLNAVSALEKPGGVIAFPSESIYQLGCLPDNSTALEKLYHSVNPTYKKPITLISHDSGNFEPYIGEMTLYQADRFQKIARKHWPGPLIIIVPHRARLTGSFVDGARHIGIQIPKCPFLGELLDMVPKGLLATSAALDIANMARSADVFQAFGQHLDFMLTDDRLVSGFPPTVVAIKADGGLSILRQGSIVLD